MKGADAFGYTFQDKITGFAGVVTGFVQYSTGCNQFLLSPVVKDGRYEEPRWFDEQRCLLLPGNDKIEIDNGANPGCDVPAPVR